VSTRKVHLSLNVFVLLVFLLATTITAAAAASEIQFLGANFIVGKGLAVTFKVSSDFDLTQLASVNVNGIHYGLECTVKEENSTFKRVVCIAGVSTASVGGEALIAFGPYTFSATLKDPRPHCYGVYDWGLPPTFPWTQIGSYCQDNRAAVGDVIMFYNPVWEDMPNYIYGNDSSIFNPSCGPAVLEFGNGYYYDC